VNGQEVYFMKKIIILLIILSLFPMSNIQAKRVAPNPIAPVIFNGVRYERSGINSVLSWDENNNKKLWEKNIYKVSYDSGKEADVQDVWITKLEVKDGILFVTNEISNVYKVDLKTGESLDTPPVVPEHSRGLWNWLKRLFGI